MLLAPRQMEVVAGVPDPSPASGEVLVTLMALGICGSDLAVWGGAVVPPTYPWILGHEAVGRIASVGEGVPGSRVGEIVVIEPNYPCGMCHSCLAARTSSCSGRQVVSRTIPGLLRERFCVPSEFAWRVADVHSIEDLVCIEPLAVADHAAGQVRPIHTGGCLVVGAGALGLMVVQLMAAYGLEVSVAEPNGERRAFALECASRKARLTEGTSFGLVFETSGTVDGLREAVNYAQTDATVVALGLPHGDIPMPVETVVRKQITLVGSAIYDHPDGFSKALGLVDKGILSPGRILGRRYELSMTPEAFASAGTLAGKTWIVAD